MANIRDALDGALSPEVLDDLVTLVEDVLEDKKTASETVTSGALSLVNDTSVVSVTGTQAYTLADGLYDGQQKYVWVSVAASTPDGTLTPATFADGTSIDLDAVGEMVLLKWVSGTGWQVQLISGATITP